MADPKELIYQNANTYRLHADNLRWSLLAGFAAFLAAIFSMSQSQLQTIKLDSLFFNFLAFIVSFAYLWIIAIQNWFYNLFAQFVDNCESRLLEKKDFISLQSFAKQYGEKISPFHPAFFLAEFIVASVAYYFLCGIFDNLNFAPITDFIFSYGENTPILIKFVCYLIYMSVLHLIFKNWNKLVWLPIIKPLSNIYKQHDIST